MLICQEKKQITKLEKKNKRYQRELESQQKENYSAFLAASGGDPAVIVKDRDAVRKFFVEKMGFTEDDEFDMQ